MSTDTSTRKRRGGRQGNLSGNHSLWHTLRCVLVTIAHSHLISPHLKHRSMFSFSKHTVSQTVNLEVFCFLFATGYAESQQFFLRPFCFSTDTVFLYLCISFIILCLKVWINCSASVRMKWNNLKFTRELPTCDEQSSISSTLLC